MKIKLVYSPHQLQAHPLHRLQLHALVGGEQLAQARHEYIKAARGEIVVFGIPQAREDDFAAHYPTLVLAQQAEQVRLAHSEGFRFPVRL